MNQIYTQKLDNGLTVVAEQRKDSSCAAFCVLVPIGAATDPEGFEGSANILSNMFEKGAGDLNAMQLSDECDGLGLTRSISSGSEFSVFSGALLSENLTKALDIYSKMLLSPHLPAAELDNVRNLAIQDLISLEDKPSEKVLNELSKHFYPWPLNRSQLGTLNGLKAVTADSLKDYYKKEFVPSGSIISVAGKFNWLEVIDTINKTFGSWKGGKEPLKIKPKEKNGGSFHIDQQTSQLQIGLAYNSVSLDHKDYYKAKLAVVILSGGMAGRLFIEVREKRGLVYAVYAAHRAKKNMSGVFVYAGTTPENAAETFSVIIKELKKLETGISKEELERAKADIKSALIMNSETSFNRVASIAGDMWNLGRVRSLDEIKENIDKVTVEDVIQFLKAQSLPPITLVTLGSKEIKIS